MTRTASRMKKAISLLLVVAFVFATGPDVFGIHDCPYHGHSEADQAPGAAAPVQASGPDQPETPSRSRGAPNGSHSGGAFADGASHDGPHSDRPCTWLVDCHASIESAPYMPAATVVVSAPLAHSPLREVAASQAPLGPRHLLFELHLPNAPPLRA